MDPPRPISLDLGLEGSHVVVTGGAGLIGRVVVDAFMAAGAHVSSLDIGYPVDAAPKDHGQHGQHGQHGEHVEIHCDISDELSVRDAFQQATSTHGPVEVCIALAALHLSVLQPASFADASFAQLKRVLDVNVAGTWLTAREWLRGLRLAKSEGTAVRNANLVIVGSESGHFGERLNAEVLLIPKVHWVVLKHSRSSTGRPVMALSGRAHFYEGHTMEIVTFATRLCAVLQVETMICEISSFLLSTSLANVDGERSSDECCRRVESKLQCRRHHAP